jgi:membrane-associated phospholipid phosphatase
LKGKIMGRSFGVAAALLALVLTLGLCVSHGWGGALDHALASAFGLRAGQSSATLIRFWQLVSWSGGGTQRYIIVGLLALALGVWHQKRAGLTLALASLLSSFASDGLKMAFARARPDLVPHLDHASSFAYPSGHATSAAVVYLAFALLIPTQRRTAWLAGGAALALLTGLSRIMLGVHWPSDVLGGWMLGAAFAIGGVAIARRWEGNR